MSETNTTQDSETSSAGAEAGGESFAELFGKGPAIKEGELAKGKVLSIDDDHVQVDIGYKSEGLVPTWEFMTDDGELMVKVGDTVDVLVEVGEDATGGWCSRRRRPSD